MVSSARALIFANNSEIPADIPKDGVRGKFEFDDQGNVEVKELLLDSIKSATECVVVDVSSVRVCWSELMNIMLNYIGRQAHSCRGHYSSSCGSEDLVQHIVQYCQYIAWFSYQQLQYQDVEMTTEVSEEHLVQI